MASVSCLARLRIWEVAAGALVGLLAVAPAPAEMAEALGPLPWLKLAVLLLSALLLACRIWRPAGYRTPRSAAEAESRFPPIDKCSRPPVADDNRTKFEIE